MFRAIYCQKTQLVSPCKRNVGDSAARLLFLVRDALVGSNRSISSVSANKDAKENEKESRRLFLVSYLVNSCGFSQEDANSIAEKPNFTLDGPGRPDSVLNFLKNHGFSDTHITKIVRTTPRILMSNVTVLSPKLSFFRSLGFSDDDIVKVFTLNPTIFATSLNNRLIPWYNFLKSVLGQDDAAAQYLKRTPYVFNLDPQNDVAPKFSALRETGVPDFLLLRLLRYQHRGFCMSSDKFDEIVKKIVGMGINPGLGIFVNAFEIFRMKKSTLERRLEVYKEWGWSEDEIWSMFKKNPQFLKMSGKLTRSKMDFLKNKMGFELQDIARLPAVLNYSLQKRIVPRFSVIRVLQMKGLIKQGTLLYSITLSSEHFLKHCVTKYQDEVPGLLDIYYGKTNIQDLDLGFEQSSVSEKTLQSSSAEL